MTQAERMTLNGLNSHIIELKGDVGELKADMRFIKETLAAAEKVRDGIASRRWQHKEFLVGIAAGLVYPAYSMFTRLFLHW